MTANSFTNYKNLFGYKYMEFILKLNRQYQNGAPSYRYYEVTSALLSIYDELLSLYTLVSEEEDDVDYVDNFLTPTEMMWLSEFANRILDIDYVVDFLATATDEWGSIPAFVYSGAGNEADVAETKQTVL